MPNEPSQSDGTSPSSPNFNCPRKLSPFPTYHPPNTNLTTHKPPNNVANPHQKRRRGATTTKPPLQPPPGNLHPAPRPNQTNPDLPNSAPRPPGPARGALCAALPRPGCRPRPRHGRHPPAGRLPAGRVRRPLPARRRRRRSKRQLHKGRPQAKGWAPARRRCGEEESWGWRRWGGRGGGGEECGCCRCLFVSSFCCL